VSPPKAGPPPAENVISMQLHELKAKSHRKSKKRIGRGGKRGTYSGRGQKGQKSRAGHRIRPALRDLLIRIPKLRGFKNKSLFPKHAVLTLSRISKMKAAEVNTASLREEKVIGTNFSGTVKVLDKGEITRPVIVRGIAVSGSAREKIEKAGGKVL